MLVKVVNSTVQMIHVQCIYTVKIHEPRTPYVIRSARLRIKHVNALSHLSRRQGRSCWSPGLRQCSGWGWHRWWRCPEPHPWWLRQSHSPVWEDNNIPFQFHLSWSGKNGRISHDCAFVTHTHTLSLSLALPLPLPLPSTTIYYQ